MKKVLITGATGATGGNAIKKLLELKVPVRALVHQVDERSKKLSSQGVEIVQGDLTDFETVSEALQGITATLVLPADSNLESNRLYDEIQKSADFGRRKILGRVQRIERE